MAVYYMNEAAFELPDRLGFVDRTTTALAAISRGGYGHTLRVYRLPAPGGKPLHALVAEQIREANIVHRGHTVLFEREREIGGQPAIDVGARWRGLARAVYTRQAHVLLGGTFLVWSCSAELDERALCDEMLEHALATFRPRL